MKMRLCLVLAATALLSARGARGDLIGISANNIVWDAVGSPDLSPEITVALTNAMVNNADTLAGWQLRLQVVPAAGATGTVDFHNDALPTDGSYILAGRSSGLMGGIGPAQTMLFAFDSDANSPPTGVNVPAMGKTLLNVDFFTNDMAQGRFLLQAIGGLGDTQWSDGKFMDRGFVNIPLQAPGNVVTIAQINIQAQAVPEPSSLVLTVFALPGLWLALRVGRRAGRPQSSSAP